MAGLGAFVFGTSTPRINTQQPPIPTNQQPLPSIADLTQEISSVLSEQPNGKPTRGLYALSIASETIQVTIGSKPKNADYSDSPKQQSYHLHISKLRQTSDYFDGLFRFNGTEIQQNHIYLNEGFEDLALAFDAFVEFMYTHSYKNTTEGVSGLNGSASRAAELDASIIVLAERLVVPDLKNMALDALETGLTPYLPGLTATQRAPESIVKIIRMIYDGTHRPYGDVGGIKLDKKPYTGRALPSLSASRFSTTSTTQNTPGAFPSSPARQANEEILARRKILPITALKLPGSSPTAIGYKNCRARKIVARHCAQHLCRYRGNPEFRYLVSEIGEFAVDVMMEEIVVADSGLIVVL